MKKCTNCGKESYRLESKFCLGCGAQLPEQGDEGFVETDNICTNPNCEFHKTRFIYPHGACFCDACGSKTANPDHN